VIWRTNDRARAWVRWTRRAAIAAAAAGSAACGSLIAKTTPSPKPEWPQTIALARTNAAAGNFGAADSILSGFATRYAGTTYALEAGYYRAVFMLDPSNPHTSLPGAVTSLDAYLADTRPRQHVAEAATLRRVATQLEGLTHVAANAVAQAKDATNTANSAKAQAADAAAKVADTPPNADAEIKRLKDELAKANAELDRIRKRLAQPPPRR
jgi:hypothetical protein